MLHIEHLRKADESYEIRHDNNGNVIHVITKDGEAIVFPSLWDLVQYEYLGVNDIERFYVDDIDLDKIYDSEDYDYYKLKVLAQEINNG